MTTDTITHFFQCLAAAAAGILTICNAVLGMRNKNKIDAHVADPDAHAKDEA